MTRAPHSIWQTGLTPVRYLTFAVLLAVQAVALTAQTSVAHRANALEAGFDGFLTKPFRKTELAEAIERYLRAP